MKIPSDRESFIPSRDFTAEVSRMSENHTCSYRKAIVGKKKIISEIHWQITFSSYKNTLNEDHDSSMPYINLGHYLDKTVDIGVDIFPR